MSFSFSLHKCQDIIRHARYKNFQFNHLSQTRIMCPQISHQKNTINSQQPMRAKGLTVLVSPNQSDRKGNNHSQQMQVEEIFIWGKKRKKNRRISLLDDYYYQTTSSVANQNAGFALIHQLGDTNSTYPLMLHIPIQSLYRSMSPPLHPKLEDSFQTSFIMPSIDFSLVTGAFVTILLRQSPVPKLSFGRAREGTGIT